MPTYEYRCEKCGQEFEQFQTITAKPVSKCPNCHGKVKRLLGSGSGFISKGKTSSSSCGQDTPCCGRDSFCHNAPCRKT